jgi:hypothetical protein
MLSGGFIGSIEALPDCGRQPLHLSPNKNIWQENRLCRPAKRHAVAEGFEEMRQVFPALLFFL